MISVQEAATRIVSSLRPVASEHISISEGEGRVLASDAMAEADQPPNDVSSMDGMRYERRTFGMQGLR